MGIDWVAVAIYAAVAAVVSGISYGVQTALAPNPSKPIQSGRIDQLRQIARDNTAPIRVVYGTFRASGVLLFARAVNRDGIVKAGAPYLHFMLALAHGPVADVYDIQLNDEPADSNTFSDLALLTPFMGFVDQPMLVDPLELDGVSCELPKEWLETYRPLRQVSWIHGLLKNDPRVFPGGAPNVRATIKGRLLYDKRDPAQSVDDETTWRWSNNWAVCVRDFLTSREYGYGEKQSAICEDCFEKAADDSDELISAYSDVVAVDNPTIPLDEEDHPNVPKIPRYTCDGLFETDEKPVDILQRILAAGAGNALFYGGKWHIKAGAKEDPAQDVTTGEDIILTPDDLRAGAALEVTRLPGRGARTNTMRGTFVNPAKQFIPDNFPPVTDPRFLAQDGNIELSQQLQLDFTQHIDRARFIAGIFLRQSRMMQARWPGRPYLAQVVPMSVIQIVHPFLGWGFLGTVSVDAGTKTYSATNVGLNIKVGEEIRFARFADPANNGKKKVAARTDDSITVEETCVDEVETENAIVAAKQFLVRDRIRNEQGAIDLLLEEYTDANFAQDLKAAALPVSTNLPAPFYLDPPTDVAASEVVQINPDGSRTSKVNVTWAEPAEGIVEGYEVAWRAIGQPGSTTQRARIPAPATRFEITNLAVGLYAITVQSTLNVAKSTPAATQVEVTYRTAPPPSPINLRVRTTPNGTRVLTWGMPGADPADLLGFRVAWIAGTVDDGLAAWDSANVLPQIVRGRSFETARPSTPGTYTFLVRAIDNGQTLSNNVAEVVVTIPPLAPDVIADIEWGELAWPGNTSGARVNADGELEARGLYTWDDLSTWDSWTSWDQGARVLIYESEPIDFGTERSFTLDAAVTGRHYSTAIVASRIRQTPDEVFGSYALRAGGSGRQIQFRVTLYGDGTGAPVMEQFRTTARERLSVESFDDIDMTDVGETPPFGVFSRGESTGRELALGVQVNTQPMFSDGVASLEIDDEASVLLNGSNHYVEVADAERLRLQGTSWAVELLAYLPTSGTGRLISKGDDWWIGTASGNWTFGAVGYTGGDPSMSVPISGERRIHHLAVVRDGGNLHFYDWGTLQKTIKLTTELAESADPLTFGGSKVSGTPGDFRNVALEEVRVWQVARSADQLRGWGDAFVDPNAPGLVGYWRCSEGSGSTIRDLTANNHGTISGAAATWVRMAERISPPINLAILPAFGFGFSTWFGATPTDTSLTVEVSTQPAGGWTAATGGGGVANPLPGITPGTDTAGRVIRVRQFLYSTDIGASPALKAVSVSAAGPRGAGQLIVPARARFGELRQATIVAVQNTQARPAWRLEAKDAVGARFSLWNAETGVPLDAVVDVELRGARVL